MKQLKRKTVIGVLLMALLVTPLTVSAASGEIVFNGFKTFLHGVEYKTYDSEGNLLEPFLYKNNMYLPMDAVLKSLGRNARWDAEAGIFYFGPSEEQPSVNTGAAYLIDVAKAYQTDGRGHKYEEYSSKNSTGKSYFEMAGVKYYDGAYLQNSTYSTCYSLYNIGGNYKTLKAVLGHVDGTHTNPRTFSIYGDDILLEEYEVTGDMIPTNISIDVTNVSILKIEITENNVGYDGSSPAYGLGNATVQ